MNSELRWKTLFRYYEISSDGDIQENIGDCESVFQIRDLEGIQTVRLPLSGRTDRHSVADLVAGAFIGERPFGNWDLEHIDGNPVNNRAYNLQWIPSDDESVNADNRTQVQWSRAKGRSLEEIGRQFNISADVAYRILKNETPLT